MRAKGAKVGVAHEDSSLSEGGTDRPQRCESRRSSPWASAPKEPTEDRDGEADETTNYPHTLVRLYLLIVRSASVPYTRMVLHKGFSGTRQGAGALCTTSSALAIGG